MTDTSPEVAEEIFYDIPNDIWGTIISFSDVLTLTWLDCVNQSFRHLVTIHAQPKPNKRKLVIQAIRGQYFELVKWLYYNGFEFDAAASIYAISRHRLDILIWLVANGCTVAGHAVEYALAKNDLPILQWLIIHGCEYSVISICKAAVEHGNLLMLDWIISHLYQASDDETLQNIAVYAATSNCLSILQWFYQRFTILEPTSEIFHAAVISGSLEILEWLYITYPYFSTFDCQVVAPRVIRAKRLSVFQWLVNKKLLKVNINILIAVAKVGSIPMMTWYHDQNHTFTSDERICNAAAAENHQELFHWLQEHGYEYDQSRCDYLFTNKQLQNCVPKNGDIRK
jgi:hypothetical protein